jgi:hypothetical protein
MIQNLAAILPQIQIDNMIQINWRQGRRGYTESSNNQKTGFSREDDYVKTLQVSRFRPDTRLASFFCGSGFSRDCLFAK